MAALSIYIAPLLVFGLVVFVHELGHFVAAKLCGVYAPVFSLGWGGRLFGWKRGETDYRVSLIPLGGFVRMASREDEALVGIEGGAADRGSLQNAPERPTNISPALWDPQGMAPFGPRPVPANRWVESKSTSARVFMLAAGVIMNILLTMTVTSGIYYRYGKAYLPAVIDSVVPGAPAAAAGLASGDRIVAIDGDSVRAWEEVIARVSPVTSGVVTFDIVRNGARLQKQITPQAADAQDPVTGAPRKVGRVGMMVRDSVVREAVSAGEAVANGSRATWGMARNVFSVLGGLVSGEVSAKNLGGPIQIARTSVQAARNGAETLWSLIAFLSLNIAILNLIPIPVLDGGQILMVLAERIKGSTFSLGTREAFARVGVLAVLALILLVTFNDLRSVFTQ
ncbi:RIP metalloprotease RseP [Gemmatimonas sp.]|jgi:regulator of sigma E protease|uniref:RIP metalloprotease RseP n=1 Tax=Gemmatimonas sp. TaxID=1962908 RepID=UPI0037BEC75A